MGQHAADGSQREVLPGTAQALRRDHRTTGDGERSETGGGTKMNAVGKLERPHPGLLPQERETRSPRFGDTDAPSCGVLLSAHDRATATTQAASEFFRDVNGYSFSLGERVRVRASVVFSLSFLFLFL